MGLRLWPSRDIIVVMKFTILVTLFFSLWITEAAKHRGCLSAVYAIEKPTNGKVFACCRYKKIKFVCDPGYKSSIGNGLLTCKKGRIYGTFPKCILARQQTCGLAGYNILQSRMVGGSKTRPGDWPWMTAIYHDGFYACGGALITASHVMTAAHCIYDKFGRQDTTASSYKLWLGRTNLKEEEEMTKQLPTAETIHVHPGFSRKTFSNDVAIIKLKTPVTFTKYVQPLCLPNKNMVIDEKMGYVAGWGSTIKLTKNERKGLHSSTLQHASLPIASNRVCAKAASIRAPFQEKTMLCAGDGRGVQDACHGDSGGPLVVYEKIRGANRKVFYKWTAVGIVSWGEGCAQENKYGYFTRLTANIDWIHKITGQSD